MPWASPPCTWPRTSTGLRIRPQSSTDTCRIRRHRRRCRRPPPRPRCACRTGTSSPSRGTRPSTPGPGSMPSGTTRRVGRGRRQIRPRDRALGRAAHRDPPLGERREVLGIHLQQVGGQDPRLRATASARSKTDDPPACSDRDPHVPAPRGTRPLSECTTSIVSIATPITEDTICANAVSWPCPCGDVPVSTVTAPSAPHLDGAELLRGERRDLHVAADPDARSSVDRRAPAAPPVRRAAPGSPRCRSASSSAVS